MGNPLWAALQPIINIHSGEIIGHEALLRGAPHTHWESPDVLFAIADRLGHRTVLEANARCLALNRLRELPLTQNLFLNVDALSCDIPAMPGHRYTDPRRVVLEISERQPILDNPILLKQVPEWKKAGHLIALDDYGSGYMGLGAILMLEPDILKLDRIVIAGIDHNPVKQKIIRAMAHLAKALGLDIIAEGIETQGELDVLRDSGILYGQGYLLGRPSPFPLVPQTLPMRDDAPPISSKSRSLHTDFTKNSVSKT